MLGLTGELMRDRRSFTFRANRFVRIDSCGVFSWISVIVLLSATVSDENTKEVGSK